MLFALILIATVVLMLVLLSRGAGYWGWVLPGLGFFAGVTPMVLDSTIQIAMTAVPLTLFALAALLFGVVPVRRAVVSGIPMRILSRMLPRMSETERVALEAGTVWWDAQLFSGKPHWKELIDYRCPPLSDREQAFIDGPVETLCTMVDDWEVERAGDLPTAVWDYIKEQRFFGMIIPEEYGGLGFSALANSAVITKVSSRSVAASVTVMVPNSLGPAELLLHYGTDEQKDHYLPRLARGEEIPCFALTEPNAGSDAASIQSEGVVCRGEWQGEEILGLRLNWNKRYITLAPVATVLGLAFQMRDPEHLVGDEEELGITCALVSADLPGVEVGRRHDPLGIAFLNGPTTGKDVFVPLDCIIGGREMAGEGWKMLMQCLAAGRSISLPALATGAAQLASRTVSAYGVVREQFNVNIGAFEGVEERIARIGGLTYLMNAARVLTAGFVDSGEKPAVISAIVKAYMTELMRVVVNDAMDVQGGAGICRGPRNVIASAYQSVPVGITVEGANILTRTLIIYGQGAMRCHPHVHEQMQAVAEGDLERFDAAFFSHIGFVARNASRALLTGLTAGYYDGSPVSGVEHYYYRRFSRLSAGFATLSDAAMGIIGGALKRKEKISGRFADALAWMYLGSAVLKRFYDAGQPAKEEPFLHWACQTAMYETERALVRILDNFPNRFIAWTLRRTLFPFGTGCRPPSDEVGGRVARAMLDDSDMRDRLTADIHVPAPEEPGLGALEAAFQKAVAAQPIMKKVKDAARSGKIDKKPRSTLIPRAREAGVIDDEERAVLEEAERARDDAVQVDAFDPESTRQLQT